MKTHIVRNGMPTANINIKASDLLREQAFQMEVLKPLGVGNLHAATLLQGQGLSDGRAIGKLELEQKKNFTS
ncbi:MAG: hypothetical protein IOC35_01560 [Methylobacterium sp.]|nr:hypothetical protein [Methylobacterium sp.]